MAALFSWADWGSRVQRLFPRTWAGTNASGGSAWDVTGIPQTNGVLGGLTYGLVGGEEANPSGLPFIWQQLLYARAQCRMATITDSNVDQVGLDWFGGKVPRVVGPAGTESDRAYASRLVLTLTAGAPSFSGLEKILQAYLDAVFEFAVPLQNLAADITGGADVGAGAADVTSNPATAAPPPIAADVGVGGADVGGTFTDVTPVIGGVPTVIIFDRTSDPASSALIDMIDPSFCVFLSYANSSTSLIRVTEPIDNIFAGIVDAFRKVNTVPVYATDGPE